MWDRESAMYDKMAFMELEYTREQLKALPLRKTDHVLDIGCGPGRLTTQIAPLVAKVTAMDSAERMLECCRRNVEERGLTNVETRLLDWFDTTACDQLGTFDVVIACRTPALSDMERLDELSRRVVVCMAFANAPSIPHILDEMFGGVVESPHSRPPMRKPDRRLGYNVFFNIAYDLGHDANVRVMPDGFKREFGSRDEAYTFLGSLREVPPEKRERFRENIEPMLHDRPDGTVLFHKPTESFVLWWEK
jgi:SAM-dependent methyltransferase